MTTGKRKKAPWERAAPASAPHHALSAAKKSKAKLSAKRAGRPYPNLIDNMKVAREGRNSKARPKKK